jgi:hypothetical protein
MRSSIVRSIASALLSIVAVASPLVAQSVYDTNLRGAPQYVEYQIKSPVNETISEFAAPLFVVIPVSSIFNLDVGTAYTWARVQPNGSSTERTSTISGLTDTQIRANLSLGGDFVVLTAGVNLPTGRETASQEEQLAAFRIGSDFLSFPISNMGTGFGATGGIAIARPIGDWNLGMGASLRQSSSYEPFVANTGDRPRFQPGNEYRARIGVDHALGTGRFAIGLTYSKFGNDDIGGSIYNTGDRYVAQAGFNNTFGGTNVLLNAWNLYRRTGTIFTGERIGPENIGNVLLGIGFRAPGGVLEPSIEARSWTQQGLDASLLGTVGLRYSVEGGGVAFTPSVGYTTGRFAAIGGNANLTGFHTTLAVRLGP